MSKTPMQELLERVKEYRDSETSPLVISRLNSICVDILGMLEKEKEKEVITNEKRAVVRALGAFVVTAVTTAALMYYW